MIERLGQIVICSKVQHADAVGHFGPSGQNNDRGGVCSRTVTFQKSASVPIGQHDIQQDQIVIADKQKIRTFRQCEGMIDYMTIQTHAVAQRSRECGIVLDQQVFHSILRPPPCP